MKKKVKYIFPGESPPLDTTQDYILITNILFMSIFGLFLGISAGTFVLLNNFPVSIPKPPYKQVFDFWLFILGYVSTMFQGEGFKSIVSAYYKAKDMGLGNSYFYRFLGVFGIGILLAYIFGKSANVPVNATRHIKGRQLFYHKDAFVYLLNKFRGTEGSGLILASYEPSAFKPVSKDKDGNNVYKTITDLKKNTYIELPETYRRSHFVVNGGTGRGKTQAILYLMVYQIYNKIRKGENFKLLICDTPKSDYSTKFSKERVIKIAPHEEDSQIWDIAKDVNTNLLAKEFWTGRVEVSDQDPIWGNAAITIGTGITRYLQEIAPESWNYGQLAFLLSKPADYLKTVIPQVSAESVLLFDGAEETLGSMLQNLASSSADIIQLARIWDGFDEKKFIFQASAKALRNNSYIEFICNEMKGSNANDFYSSKKQDEWEEYTQKNSSSVSVDALHTRTLFKLFCYHLNNNYKEWQWSNFSELIKKPFKEQIQLLENNKSLSLEQEYNELKKISYIPFYWTDICSNIAYFADTWDKYENQSRVSFKKWLMTENPSRKVFILKPSSTTPSLTTGIIKGMLSYANQIILSDKFADSPTRKFNILIDEFQSYGKLPFFVKRALELYRSRGVSLTLAFQDFSQIDEIYGEQFVKFLMANNGNLISLGSNSGDTPKRLSELVGKRTINKLHRNDSFQQGGKSSSYNYQEHEEDVMTPNQFNTELGADPKTKMISLLYLANKVENALIFDIPIISYPEPQSSKPVEKPLQNFIQPKIPSITAYWNQDDDSWKIKKKEENS